MQKVQALSFDQVECGKSFAETKKRFKWKFRINGQSYTMELTNSALSGKRIVTLNSTQIYSEKSVLNIDFDFSHQIDEHNLRITRIPDNLNKFQMRIDNRSFDQLLHSKSRTNQRNKPNSSKYYINQEEDPFSQFGNAVSDIKCTNKINKTLEDFGDFDMEELSSPNKHFPSSNQLPPEQPTVQKQEFDFFDLKNQPKVYTANNNEESGDLLEFKIDSNIDKQKKTSFDSASNGNQKAKPFQLYESLI